MNTSNAMPRILGWFIGSLSLISLVASLISLRLHQSVVTLVSSYSYAVAQLFGFITAAIGQPWFSVSPVEGHFIIILVICQSALLNTSRTFGSSYMNFAIGVVLLGAADTIIFGLTPDSFLMTPLFIVVLMLFLPFYLERTGELRLQGYSTNLIGVTFFFFLITSVNSVLTLI